jgi:hypothetical protein
MRISMFERIWFRKENPKYRGASGIARWRLLRRHDIEDMFDPVTYLRRYIVFETPVVGVYVHKINRPDADRAMHDHPWKFCTFILKGGYVERTPAVNPPYERYDNKKHKRHTWRAGSLHSINLKQFHTIERLLKVPTWSLMVVGPRKQNWGFLTENGWVDHSTYISNQRQREYVRES